MYITVILNMKITVILVKKLKQLFPCIICNLLFQMNDMKDIRIKTGVLTFEMILIFMFFKVHYLIILINGNLEYDLAHYVHIQ